MYNIIDYVGNPTIIIQTIKIAWNIADANNKTMDFVHSKK